MNFTPELPTKPGYFLFKRHEFQTGCPVEVKINEIESLIIHGWNVDVKNAGGFWCRLVPEEDLIKEKERSRDYYQRLSTAFVDGRRSVVEEHLRSRVTEGVE